MAHFFDSGMFARTPAWHQLGKVLPTWPGSFEEAREEAGLTWDVTSRPVYVGLGGEAGATPYGYDKLEGWQAIVRDDNEDVLSVQQDSYAVIGNGEFGNVIDFVMNGGVAGTTNLKFETLISLKGGRQVIATMYLDQPLALPRDPSPTYPYLVFISRHDGQGGMRLGPTAVRVVCANTQALAERLWDKNGGAFTIRHTANWADRLEQARMAVQMNLKAFEDWHTIAADLARYNVTERSVEDFLDKWLPFSTDQTEREREFVVLRRQQFRRLYDGPTCEGISGTKWGVLQAAIEICDHYSKNMGLEGQVARQLTRLDDRKVKAMALVSAL